jgi:hypothetical protein
MAEAKSVSEQGVYEPLAGEDGSGAEEMRHVAGVYSDKYKDPSRPVSDAAGYDEDDESTQEAFDREAEAAESREDDEDDADIVLDPDKLDESDEG